MNKIWLSTDNFDIKLSNKIKTDLIRSFITIIFPGLESSFKPYCFIRKRQNYVERGYNDNIKIEIM